MMSVGVEAGVVVLLQLKESGLTGFDDGVYPLAETDSSTTRSLLISFKENFQSESEI